MLLSRPQSCPAEAAQWKADSPGGQGREEGAAGWQWGRKCECDPGRSSTKQEWSNWLSTRFILDWTQERATEFGETKLLRFPKIGVQTDMREERSPCQHRNPSSSHLCPALTSASPHLPPHLHDLVPPSLWYSYLHCKHFLGVSPPCCVPCAPCGVGWSGKSE